MITGNAVACGPDPQEIFDLIPTRDEEKIGRFRIDVPGALESRDKNGAIADHWLAHYGLNEMVLDWNCRDRFGNTPVFYLSLGGHSTLRPSWEREAENHFGHHVWDLQQAEPAERATMMFGDGASPSPPTDDDEWGLPPTMR